MLSERKLLYYEILQIKVILLFNTSTETEVILDHL